mmetsp:Transcript_2130/g.5276  ORF Transcript_2130/g.5276 Transcript_2130/m.5276 type:complete len:278 (+) Transcript_2130:6927-7760(+)
MGNSRSTPANEDVNRQLIDVMPPEPSSSLSNITQPTASSITATAVVNTDVHVRPDSVKLVADPEQPGVYSLKFVYDCKVESWICIYFFATENLDASGLNTFYHVSPRTLTNQIVNKHPPGLNVEFEHAEANIDISKYAEAELTAGDNPPYPFVIELKPIYSDTRPAQVHTTFVSLSKERDSYDAKVIKQKFQIGTRAYEIHEMFGIQQQANNIGEEESTECVVCMTAARDTAIVPCLHMCLCMECANILRSQPNSRCPMCRTSVSSLLQIQLGLPKA